MYINLVKNAAHCFAECYAGTAIRLIAQHFGVSMRVAEAMVLKNQVFMFDGSGSGKKYKYPNYKFNSVLEWKSCSNLPYLVNRGFHPSTLMLWSTEYNDAIRHFRLPVIDFDGAVVGHVYRTIDSLVPKYLTPGFEKRNLLFGTHMFHKHNGTVNIVEGALDCMWMWQCGYQNTLAMLGAPRGFSDAQLSVLNKMGLTNFRLCFDNDFAGIQCRIRFEKQLEALGLETTSIIVPQELGKDVQDLKPTMLANVMRGGLVHA